MYRSLNIYLVVKTAGMGRGMFAIECPPAVTHRLSNDTNGPRMMNIVNSVVAVKVRKPYRLPTHRIIENQADTQHAFLLHNCILRLTSLTFDEPTCTSNFCNCINCYDGGIKKPFCPCYARTTTKHPIVAVLDFNVTPPVGEPFSVRWFTSKSATEYFFKGLKIGHGTRASKMNEFRNRVSARRCFDSIISYVNEGGQMKETNILSEDELSQYLGWTVTGWVRRGNHADQALTQQGGTAYARPSNPQARAGVLSHHVVSIYPTCEKLLSNDVLESKRYDDSKTSNGNAPSSNTVMDLLSPNSQGSSSHSSSNDSRKDNASSGSRMGLDKKGGGSSISNKKQKASTADNSASSVNEC